MRSVVQVGRDVFHGVCELAGHVKNRIVNGPSTVRSRGVKYRQRPRRAKGAVTQTDVGRRNTRGRLVSGKSSGTPNLKLNGRSVGL